MEGIGDLPETSNERRPLAGSAKGCSSQGLPSNFLPGPLRRLVSLLGKKALKQTLRQNLPPSPDYTTGIRTLRTEDWLKFLGGNRTRIAHFTTTHLTLCGKRSILMLASWRRGGMVFRKGRAYSFPLRRRHQGRRDSWSPVRGQSRGHITRDNFKMPRTGFEFPDLDTEWKVNRRLWVSTLFFLTCRLTDFIQDLIQTEDPTLPDRDEDVFRCGQCNFFKWPWRFSKPMQQKPVEDRMCWKCEQHALSLDRMRGVPEE